MSNYVITDIKPFVSLEPNKSYLSLIAINKVPPHLAIVTDLKYFSLSSAGVKNGMDANVILNSLNRKSIPSLFLQLSQKLDVNHSIAEYSKFEQLDKGQSCLNPIKNLLTSIDDSLIKCHFAYDLIAEMYNRKLIANAFSINYNPSSLELISYGQEEIDLAIYNAAQLC